MDTYDDESIDNTVLEEGLAGCEIMLTTKIYGFSTYEQKCRIENIKMNSHIDVKYGLSRQHTLICGMSGAVIRYTDMQGNILYENKAIERQDKCPTIYENDGLRKQGKTYKKNIENLIKNKTS